MKEKRLRTTGVVGVNEVSFSFIHIFCFWHCFVLILAELTLGQLCLTNFKQSAYPNVANLLPLWYKLTP